MIGFALTEEQLAILLKMVFIANTVANSPSDGHLIRKDFVEIEEYIFQRAKNSFPMAVMEHKVGDDKHHHPSMIFESDPEVNAILDKYEEYILPFVLAEKFAEREIAFELGANARDKMSAEQYENILTEKATHFEELYRKHGFQMLEIKKEYL